MKFAIYSLFYLVMLSFLFGCCQPPLLEEKEEVTQVEEKKEVTQEGASEEQKKPPEGIEKTLLIKETLPADSGDQTIGFEDEVSIIIPSVALDKERDLVVSRAESSLPKNDLANEDSMFFYDITLEGMTEFPTDPVIVEIPFDSSKLNSEYTPAEQILALRWDEQYETWVELDFEISNGMVKIYSDHLSLLGFVILGGVAAYIASDYGEWILNDFYYTKHFRIMYSRRMIRESLIFDNEPWKRMFFPVNEALYPVARQPGRHPYFIQEIGNLLEIALANFIREGFSDPTLKTSFWRGDYVQRITVKIDSLFAQATRGPSYEKITQYIHLPTEELSSFKNGGSYVVIGHELFHRIQAEYYSRGGFVGSRHYWWLEATAEYAGNRVAWKDKKKFDIHRKQIGVDFLAHSITSTGTRKAHGWARDKQHEYATAALIEYLVENEDTKKALIFKDMFEHVSDGYPLSRLSGFIISVESHRSLASYYDFFVHFTLFCKDSFLSDFDIATFSDNNEKELAATQSIMEIPADKGKLEIHVSDNDSQAYISVITAKTKNERYDYLPIPEHRMLPGNNLSIAVEDETIVYLVAINTSASKETLDIRLKTDKTIEKHTTITTLSLQPNYSAQLIAVKIEKAEPDMSGYFEFIARRGNIEKYHPKGINGDLPEILNPVIPSQIKGDKVTSLRGSSFRKLGLTSVHIPDTVTRIERVAFGQNEISELKLGNSVRLIAEGAFADNKIETLIIPASVQEIRPSAFYNNQISHITFLGDMPTIGRHAFKNSRFTSITIGASQEIPRDFFTDSMDRNDFRHDYNRAGKAAGTYIREGRRWTLQKPE